MFLLYRKDVQLKPNFETFEEFYRNGHVMFSDGTRHSVKLVVDPHRSRFKVEADNLDEIRNSVDSDVLEDAWCKLCPEQELERLHCVQEVQNREQSMEEHVENILDWSVSDRGVSFGKEQ